MIYLFYTIHVLICLFLVLVVLLQQGKGADLSVFGGGGTMTAFGARGAATLLHKMTVFGFVGFIITTLVIGILQKQSGDSSVMSGVPVVEEEAAAESSEAEEAEEVGAFAEAEDEILPEAESFDDGTGEATDGEGTDGNAGDGAEDGGDEPTGDNTSSGS